MDMIAQLLAQHRQLEGERDALLEVLACPEPRGDAAAGARWQLYRSVQAHIALEDRELYARLVASGDAGAIRLAWEFRQQMGDLDKTLRNLIADWPVGRISRRWPEFCGAMRAFLARLDERQHQEETQLYPEAARVFGRVVA